MWFKFVLFALGILFLSACSNGAKSNVNFEDVLMGGYCDEDFFAANLRKIKKNDDVIYTGLNAGLIARNCGDFNKSNVFLDRVEEAYKYDVDLETPAEKGAEFAASVLINDTLADYEGSLYERIMVNVYKGLNFMSLNDYASARVEFNRALMRQDKAEEYFAKEIEKNKEELKRAQKDPHYEGNMVDNANIISEEYEHLFEIFKTRENFTNPYASYLASVFFFMDNDYKRADDLFRELAIINPENKEIQRQARLFKSASGRIYKDKKKYIFVIYENGLGAVRDEWSSPLPFFVDGKFIFLPVALQTLKKGEASYEFIETNGVKSSKIVDLDTIVATEFKINMPTMIGKALAQIIIKTTLNAVAANNDPSGVLHLVNLMVTAATNSADVRSWRGLAQSISVSVLENKGTLQIKNPQGLELFSSELDVNKNALVWVRSFAPSLPPRVQIMEK